MLATLTQERTPRPYQRDGIAWLRDGKRRVLTDQFGLGKTCQAIWAAETPCLIAAPTHLLSLWRREIKACYPDALVRVADAAGTRARKVQLLAGDGAFPGGIDIADFYVVNIEFLRTQLHTWFPLLKEGIIKTFIVDEAHRLRGRNSQQSQGALAITQLVPRVYMLTATPVLNQPNDLFSILRMLEPSRFGSYYKFLETYLSVLQTPWGPKILGLKKDKKLLDVWREYAMGRSHKEVAAQMPTLQESLIEVEPGPAWYDDYRNIRRRIRETYDGSPLSQRGVLQALRSATQQPKLQAVCSLITDSDCATDTIVFTYHRDLAYALGNLLKCQVITGDMPPTQREQVLKSNDFLVATFPSLAEGVDGSHLRNVIYVEHDWQPGLLEQALHRVHRPSSIHAFTNVYHVIVKRTVDQSLYNTMRKRDVTMEQIVQAALMPWEGEDDD